MTRSWKDVARTCLEGAESGAMTFPQIVGTLIEAGFDGYAADLRRATTIYYRPDGETVELEATHTQPVAEHFDAPKVKEAIGRSPGPDSWLHLPRLLRQGGRGGLRRLPGLVPGQAGALLRPHRRDAYRVLPRHPASDPTIDLGWLMTTSRVRRFGLPQSYGVGWRAMA